MLSRIYHVYDIFSRLVTSCFRFDVVSLNINTNIILSRCSRFVPSCFRFVFVPDVKTSTKSADRSVLEAIDATHMFLKGIRHSRRLQNIWEIRARLTCVARHNPPNPPG